MGLSLRTGKYGSYYGNDYNSSNALTQSQMEVNATYIYKYLSAKGWTKNSIAAILGNMQAESSINPGRWQSDSVLGDSSGHGYGLVQWTPYTKYTNWCTSNGYSDPSVIDVNLTRIIYEVDNNIQWIATSSYPMSFKEFTTSNDSVSSLAKAFVLNYERPADQSTTALNYRSSLATNWFNFISNIQSIFLVYCW